MLKADDLKIKSQNSADDKTLITNIQTNLKEIQNWLGWDSDNVSKRSILVSAGRSAATNLQKIKEAQEIGADIYCVKHSYLTLKNYGIPVKGCFILDPRPVEGISTHGKVRKDLFNFDDKETIFYVASMSNPTYAKMFKDLGKTLKGWHVMVNGMEHFKAEAPDPIYAGTSSATRAIGALQKMGYSHIELVGYDSDVEEPSDQQKKVVTPEGPPKYIPVQSVDGKQTFWSTGELVAQAQDLRVIPNYYFGKVYLSMWEGGLGYDIFQNEQKKLFTALGGTLTPNMSIDLKVSNLINGQVQDVKTFHPKVIKEIIEILNKPL